MQNNLKKIGFDLKIKKVPNDGYWGARLDEGTDERRVLEHASNCKRHVEHSVRARRDVERHILEQRAHG